MGQVIKTKQGHNIFIENDSSGMIRAKAEVASVFNQNKMDQEQSMALIEENQDQLLLSPLQIKQWAGKRYPVLIKVVNTETVDAFPIDKSDYGNVDDWLPVGVIDKVKRD